MEARTVASKWFFYSLSVFLIAFLSVAFVDNPSYEVKGAALVALSTSGCTGLMSSLALIYDELVRFK